MSKIITILVSVGLFCFGEFMIIGFTPMFFFNQIKEFGDAMWFQVIGFPTLISLSLSIFLGCILWKEGGLKYESNN